MPSWPWSSKKDGERSCYVTPKANDEEPSTGNLSSDLSKGSFPEATYSPSIKEDQIKALLYKIIGIIERKEGSLYDFQLNAPVGNGRASMVGARVFLPRQFPVERPVVQMMSPVFHPWVNQYMQAVGHPGLAEWKASSPMLLADILLEIMAEFNRTIAATSQLSNHSGQQVMRENGRGEMLSPAWGTGTSGDAHGMNLQQCHSFSPTETVQLDGFQGHGQIRSYPTSAGAGTTQRPPFEPLQRAPSVEQLSHTPIPPVPSEFPELNDKPLSQLNRLIEDDVARMALIKAMPSIVSFSDMKDQLCYENVQAATKNLEKEKELEKLQATAVELRHVLSNEVNEHDALVKQMCAFDSNARGSYQTLLKSIMQMSKECDEEGEKMAEALMRPDSSMDINTFLVDYMVLRKRYHTLAAKAEGLKRSIHMV